MPIVDVSPEVSVAYQSFGDRSDAPVLLVMGFGAQMLAIERAHVVGASMGGMIAQTMAITRPERVLTLTSMMSSTGEAEYGQSSPEAQAVLFSPKPADREGYIAAADREMVWASKRYGDPAVLLRRSPARAGAGRAARARRRGRSSRSG